jgi:hypothetical protein
MQDLIKLPNIHVLEINQSPIVSTCPWFHFCEALPKSNKKPIDIQSLSNHPLWAVSTLGSWKVARLSGLTRLSSRIFNARNRWELRHMILQRTRMSSILNRMVLPSPIHNGYPIHAPTLLTGSIQSFTNFKPLIRFGSTSATPFSIRIPILSFCEAPFLCPGAKIYCHQEIESMPGQRSGQTLISPFRSICMCGHLDV